MGLIEIQQQRAEDRFKEQRDQLDAVLHTVLRHAEDLRVTSTVVAGVTAAQAQETAVAAVAAAAAPQRQQQSQVQRTDQDIG